MKEERAVEAAAEEKRHPQLEEMASSNRPPAFVVERSSRIQTVLAAGATESATKRRVLPARRHRLRLATNPAGEMTPAKMTPPGKLHQPPLRAPVRFPGCLSAPGLGPEERHRVRCDRPLRRPSRAFRARWEWDSARARSRVAGRSDTARACQPDGLALSGGGRRGIGS